MYEHIYIVWLLYTVTTIHKVDSIVIIIIIILATQTSTIVRNHRRHTPIIKTSITRILGTDVITTRLSRLGLSYVYLRVSHVHALYIHACLTGIWGPIKYRCLPRLYVESKVS
jgi:hypothetical protein